MTAILRLTTGVAYVRSISGTLTFASGSSLQLADGTAGAPSLTFTSEPGTGLWKLGANELDVSINTVHSFVFTGSAFRVIHPTAAEFRLGPNEANSAHLFYGGANIFEQRNGTSAQRLNVYNTYTSSTNNELFSVDWQTTAGVALVGTRTAATGSVREARFVSQSANGSDDYASIRMFGASVPLIRMGRFAANGTVLSTGLTGNFIQLAEVTSVATSGAFSGVSIQPTYNQASGNAANTDLLINRTETAVGSGTQRLIDAQVGGASRFNVTSAGGINALSAAVIYAGTAIPAGGTAGSGYRFSSATNFGVFFGSGVPTLSAAQGSLYMRSDGSSTSTRLYVNTDGATAWTNVTTAT